MTIQDLIAPVSEQLTPTERRIAEVVLDDPTLLAFGTVSDLADLAETSRPSIVRFANKLGFEGYTELQNRVRSELSSQLSSPSQRIRQGGAADDSTRASIEAALHQTFDTLDRARLKRLAKPIASAKRVWIISGETSMAGAIVLHSGLSMVRPDVYRVEEQSSGRDLSSASKGDTAVVFDFARYRRNSITAARKLAELGVTIVAITDSPLSPLASLTKHWCELKIPAVGPFDSALPVVLTAELLVARVVEQLGDRAREQIDQLEGLWQATGVFLSYSPRPERTNS